MIRATVDINVLVSWYISPSGIPARIWHAWRNAVFVLITSEPILSEFQRVMGYPHIMERHSLMRAEIAIEVADVRGAALIVTPNERVTAVHDDPDDDKFLECALAGGGRRLRGERRQGLAAFGRIPGHPHCHPC